MNTIFKLMNLEEHCPTCGALLNGQNACGNCDYELTAEIHNASLIVLPKPHGLNQAVEKLKIA